MREYYCYVYYDEHWQAYYVGKGKRNRKTYRRGILIPDAEHIQVFYFPNEWQAFECEISLIHFWQRKIDGGCLENVALGGPGCPGVTPNTATRKRLSDARRRLPNAKEIVDKMRLACIKPISLYNIETKETLTFDSGEAACSALGLTRSALSEVRNGTRKTHKKWRLLNE